MHYDITTKCTPLALALLAGSDDLESRSSSLFFTLRSSDHSSGRALLGDFTPATAVLLLAESTGRDRVDNTLVSELAATNELFRKAATVKGLRVRVYGIGNNLRLGGEEEKLLDEIVD